MDAIAEAEIVQITQMQPPREEDTNACSGLQVLFRNVGDNKKALQGYFLIDLHERPRARLSCLCPVPHQLAFWACCLLGCAGDVFPPVDCCLPRSQLRCLQPAIFTSYDQLRYHLNQRSVLASLQQRCSLATVAVSGSDRPYRDIFFNPSGCGVPILLFSMIWTEFSEFSAAQLQDAAGLRRFEKHAELVRTRGVEGCRARDFDDPKTGAMVGGHGYCTQERGRGQERIREDQRGQKGEAVQVSN